MEVLRNKCIQFVVFFFKVKFLRLSCHRFEKQVKKNREIVSNEFDLVTRNSLSYLTSK